MKSTLLEIQPQKGLSTLPFGATMKDVERLYGKPQCIENINDVEECKSIVWNYWESGLSIFFDESNKRFTCAEIDNANAMLWGEKIFTLSEKEIISLFKTKGYLEVEAEMHEWGEKRLSFDEALVDLYFEKGRLASVNFGVFFEHFPIELLNNTIIFLN